ncbi:uncharacterized protein I206_100335 [Kwoniella pini CBS 10737]|uniref:N-acetyltransferase domain-containing protein n=1 Tax=Kwoniella pini CBS 10737 TaxID=1296096 RepID=A0A1B9IE32_9TREE|nr:uncharacterized protein I206_00990 [Kwoniella pini CBS 10737]OCF53684.1 hypothetical protein I206_00990 [Kwoniella pini CBS 10737]
MTAYLNTYSPKKVDVPRDIHLHTPPEEYDYNFCFEVKELQSDRVQLRPFVPSLHAQLFIDGLQKCGPDFTAWLIDWHSLEDVLVWQETVIRSQPSAMTYAIYTAPPASDEIVDPKNYEFAGMISMINSDVANMSSEPGWVCVLEKFQRTHVLTHAAGLIIHRILDMPSEGGLGLRRCQWFTTTLNEKSKAAALRLGFKLDGILRTHRVLAKGKKGVRPGRKGDYQEDQMTRDSWLASIGWDQWEEGIREHVDKLMARRK